jgi:hypothetical protein
MSDGSSRQANVHQGLPASHQCILVLNLLLLLLLLLLFLHGGVCCSPRRILVEGKCEAAAVRFVKRDSA